jgi:hypothetical protein
LKNIPNNVWRLDFILKPVSISVQRKHLKCKRRKRCKIRSYVYSAKFRASVFRRYSQYIRIRPVGSQPTMRKEARGETLHDKNIGRVAAIMKEHRNGSCRLVWELSVVPKTVVQQIVKNGL